MINFSLTKQLHGANGSFQLNIEAKISSGEIIALYGESGAGKTTLLKMLAGLISPDSGHITQDQSIWYDSSKNLSLSVQKRKVGFVFQDYALFPNMTVLENLVFALNKKDSLQTVEELIELMDLHALTRRRPQELSGGQQQRVALARALVQKPSLLLLDEPMSSLDSAMRKKLQAYILELQKRYNLTIVLVSHDASEILSMCQRMIILKDGVLSKDGTPEELLSNREVSGKFQFTGEVMKIIPQDFIYIVSILIGTDLVKVIADESEVNDLHPGDKVLVASKAFNPIIRKLE